jgi:glutaredoxin-like YruB-family protein
MADLTIYTQPSCGYCNELKDYLKKHNIHYEERDITKDRSAFEDLVNKYKIRATPVIVYREKTVVGFNPDEIQKLLREPQAAEAR